MRFRLLGSVEVDVDGRPVDIGHARQQLVLVALLVDANTTASDDQIVSRVWGDTPPRSVATTLRGYVARLRQVMAVAGEVAIVRRPGGYHLAVEDPLTIDTHHFADLVAAARTTDDEYHATDLFAQALGLWRGAPLTGLDSAWAATLRDKLLRQRAAAEMDHTDLRLRHDDAAELVAELVVRAGEHPLDERLAGQLMLALYRAGRQDEALAHYQRVRTRLAEELGTDPGVDLRRLHQQILTADSAVRVSAPARATSSAPRQLPAPPAWFVGRHAELETLTRALTAAREPANRVMTALVVGTGGIGKTAMALRWAHDHMDAFPDGQLYVNLRGFDPAQPPTPPAVAIRGLLEALGVTGAALPADPDAQTALYRDAVAGKRMLIVLDNARDTAHVVPLLPGSPTCAVLVTSRDRLAGLVATHGAHPVLVGALAEHDARALLTTRLGPRPLATEPDAINDLVARCAGLPLALSILAGRAIAHPGFPLAALAAELRDATTRLSALDDGDPAASLPSVLSWSYTALTREQARVFGLLGSAPGPDIGVHAVANLVDLPPDQSAQVLRSLEHVSLVHQTAPGRYRMHDLVRLYAMNRADHDLTDSARDTAARRLTDFYTHTAFTGNQLLHPHGVLPENSAPPHDQYPYHLTLPDKTAAIAWFEAEHACLMATVRPAMARGWHHTVWRLAWALTAFHHRGGLLHDDLAIWPLALEAAERVDEPAIRILARRRLGLACARTGRHTDALAHLGQALSLAEQAGDVRSQAITHHDLAQTWELQGDDQSALRHATDALRLFQTLDNPVWEAQALNGVGWYLTRLGRHDEARTHCETALALYRRHNHTLGTADVLDSLGLIAHHSQRHQDALHYYRQALELYREAGNTYLEADTLGHLGHTHVALGQDDPALVTWQQALSLFREQHRTSHATRLQSHVDALVARTPNGTRDP